MYLLVVTALSIQVSAGLSITLSDIAFNITDFYHNLMQPLKNFYTPLSGAPQKQKCFQSGPALANTCPGCLTPVISKRLIAEAFHIAELFLYYLILC